MAAVEPAQFAQALGLERVYDAGGAALEITSASLNRPGLQLSGYFRYFPAERVQILGRQEITYLYDFLDDDRRAAIMDTFMSHPLPCAIVTRGMQAPAQMLEAARRYERPVFRTALGTNRFMQIAADYLDTLLAPRITRHGVLLDINGVGVFLTGESGMGKSETALELIHRGHRLVADDAVEIRRTSSTRLVGAAPELVRHFMEIRGVGIINIRRLYGTGSVMNEIPIDMVIELETWDNTKHYDRVGVTWPVCLILGVELPKLTIPVMPGRNLAIVVEVAARNFRLKNMGYNSAQELQKRFEQRDDH